MFEGRLLNFQQSMSNEGVVSKDFDCEGLESFLHDSSQPWAEFHNISPKDFLQSLINEHNKQVEPYKQIKLGTVTVTNSTDNVYRFSDDTKDTYDNIKEKLLIKLGGEIRVRHELDGLYLDYLPEIAEQSNQIIRLQSNLLSISQKLDSAAAYSVLKPLGKTEEKNSDDSDDSEPQEVSTPRLTIASVNQGSPFLRNDELVAQIGVITHVEAFDEIDDSQKLMDQGLSLLANQQPTSQQMQVKAVDLSLVRNQIDDFECGNYHRIINPVMVIDQVLRIVGQTIDICSPANSTLTIGDVLIGQERLNVQLSSERTELTKFRARMNYQDIVLNGLNTGAVTYQSKNDKTIKQLTDRVQELEKAAGITPTEDEDKEE